MVVILEWALLEVADEEELWSVTINGGKELSLQEVGGEADGAGGQ